MPARGRDADEEQENISRRFKIKKNLTSSNSDTSKAASGAKWQNKARQHRATMRAAGKESRPESKKKQTRNQKTAGNKKFKLKIRPLKDH